MNQQFPAAGAYPAQCLHNPRQRPPVHMTHFELKAYGADRMVIGIQNADLHKKIFQINFKSKDGSLFVSVPYARLGAGRIGVVEYPAGCPESLHFGESAPVTTHAVKYSHHPDGEAHFSLDGKIITRVRRRAVPLTAAGGHLFTLMVQGLHRFDDFTENDVATRKRGIASMPVREGQIDALKFVGHLHSSTDFAMSLKYPRMDSELLPVEFADGRRLVAAVLATKLFQRGRPYLLIVSVEEINTIATYTDFCVWLMGGFDPPEIIFDHSQPMSFLMMMYPELGELTELLGIVGSIDRLLPG